MQSLNGFIFKIKKTFFLHKLWCFGIRGNAICPRHLYPRSHTVCISSKSNGETRKFSSIRTIACGVRQGAILGPSILLLYVKELPGQLESAVLSSQLIPPASNLVLKLVISRLKLPNLEKHENIRIIFFPPLKIVNLIMIQINLQKISTCISDRTPEKNSKIELLLWF